MSRSAEPSLESPAPRRPLFLRWSQWRLWLAGLVGSRYDGMRHFAVVAPGVLMRCGQPRLRDLERIADEHGLRTIVVARGGTRHPLRGRWFRRQQEWCERRGVGLVHVPFSDKELPPEDVFERFLEVVRAEGTRPVLVHCEQGWHRTGVLCAAYRIALEGWSVDQAIGEMERCGFEAHKPKRRPLVDALRAWAARRASAT